MKDISFLKDNLIVHRGYFDIDRKIPENTIKAFKLAYQNNYIIELDVRMLKDNNVIVFHDDNLERLCNVNKEIKNCSYEEIRALRIQSTNNYIPLLKNALRIINGKVPIIIEIKYSKNYDVLLKELIKILNNYKGLYVFQSFYPKVIYWLKKHAKNIPRGLVVYKYNGKNLFTNVFNCFLSTSFISCNKKGYIKNNNKKLVFGWTIKDRKDFNKYKLKFDNLICENINTYV